MPGTELKKRLTIRRSSVERLKKEVLSYEKEISEIEKEKIAVSQLKESPEVHKPFLVKHTDERLAETVAVLKSTREMLLRAEKDLKELEALEKKGTEE
ncbi:hypothetical protein NEOKW01_1508 [Nematocida sp. AWRm80]|nr:hypothetical protein NEOKW01_1508 [Nematocida sp. AWRm80]